MIVARVATSLGVFVCVTCRKPAIVGVIDLPPSAAAMMAEGPMARDAVRLARGLQDALEEG